MINRLVRAGSFKLYTSTAVDLAILFMTAFSMFLLWQLYRGMQWFVSGMGLY